MWGAQRPRYPREILLNQPASSFADYHTICNNLDDVVCTNLPDAIKQLSSNISNVLCLTPRINRLEEHFPFRRNNEHI
jgi:hypothetical protein